MQAFKPVNKVTIVTLLLILNVVNLQGQTPVIEQLRSELNLHPQEDTFRINRLNKLGFQLRNKKPKEAQALFSDALVLSRKLKYELGEANALLSLSFYLRFNGEYPEAITLGKQSLVKFIQLKDTTNMISCIYNLAYITYFQGDLAQSISYSFSALRLAEKIKSSKWLILTNTQLGNTFMQLNEITKAKHHLSDAMKMAESVNDQDGMEHCFVPLGNIAVR